MGGTGIDSYDLSGTSAGVTITVTTASSAETGSDTLSSIETIVGSQGNGSITVNRNTNTIDSNVDQSIKLAGIATVNQTDFHLA